jgi:4-hydroxyacetophenone monooxygenase
MQHPAICYAMDMIPKLSSSVKTLDWNDRRDEFVRRAGESMTTKSSASPLAAKEHVLSELLAASDQQIEEAVQFADPMCLRGLIYQLTGDEEVANTRVAKAGVQFSAAYSPATDADVKLIQKKAAEFLKSYRDSGAGPLGPGPLERLPRSLALTAGEELDPAQTPMWIEELALDPWARALDWKRPPAAEKLKKFKVAVIGAGLSGLSAIVQLKKAGIPYVAFEKNPEVGGTWYENSYIGARVDSPSRAYTHIFGADFMFDYAFSRRDDNQKYFKWVTDHFGIRKDILFNTEVRAATWDDNAQIWKITTNGPEGEREHRVNAIIAGTGIFNRPNVPNLKGIETFNGPSFHTSRWPKDLDLKGKHVAVVGTAATGNQLIPEIAKVAGHVTVFQRRPQWCFAIPGYLSPLPRQLIWLDRNLPYHINFMRFRTHWITGEEVFGHNFTIDPDWQDSATSSASNQRARNACIAYIREKFAARPELIDAMIPVHPVYSARPILVDSAHNIYDALLRDNVTLVTHGVDSVTPEGLLADGTLHKVDIIVWATGFHANQYLMPMKIRGRNGISIEELWAKDGARAYAGGSMIPGIPNFFMLYGPNTNPSRGGHIVSTSEIVSRLALKCFERLIVEDKHAVEVTREGFRKYNELLDQREKLGTYTDPRARNYYMNEFNRSAVISPFRMSETWWFLRDIDSGDLSFS